MASRVEALYADALAELKRRLNALDLFPVRNLDFSNEDHILKFVTSLLAAGAYGNGCAILHLYRGDIGRQIPPIVRSQFEAVVKLTYCEYFPRKARDYVDSEPFERWMTARGKNLRPELQAAISNDCLTVLRLRPNLIKDEKFRSEILAGKMPIPEKAYKRVAKTLAFDDLASLMRAIDEKSPGWTTDLYATVYRIGSLGIHQSVVYLRDAFSIGAGGEVRYCADQHYDGAPDYLLQSSNYMIGLAAKVAQRFGGGPDDPGDPLRELYERQQEIVRELKAGDLL